MKILITGAAGQLGHCLCDTLPTTQPGAELLATDRDSLDITDADAVMTYVTAAAPTHIINCAAYTAVDRAEEERLACTRLNVDAVKNLALAANVVGAQIIHISTDYVFDGTGNRPYRESDKPAPLSHYGETKRQSETTLLGLCPDAVILRTGWLYSPYGKNFVKTMLRLSSSHETLPVVFDQTGTPTYAGDLAACIATILAAPHIVPGIYHYANEGVASWYDFAHAIFTLSDTPCRALPITTDQYPTAAERPAYSVLDKTKIKATYSLAIPHWRDALCRCLKLINDNN